MNKENASWRLAIFLGFVLIGILLGSIFSIVPGILQGLSYDEIAQNPELLTQSKNPTTLKLLLFINHFFLFLLPALLYGLIVFSKDFLAGFELSKAPKIFNVLLGLMFLLAAYPLVSAVFYINSLVPLPEWAITAEQNVAEMLRTILDTDNVFTMLVNIALISVMPAIGEELVFRGVLQKNFGRIFRNGHIAIWLAAAIFSGIHFQFEGFLSRMVLGAIMGYCYYFTRNLWVPIIIHFVNNLIPILVLMITSKDLTDTSTMEDSPNLLMVFAAIAGVSALSYAFIKYNKKEARHV